MLIIYILLGIIAVGVLLLSEPGKRIINFAFSGLWILLITSGFVFLAIWLWSVLYQNRSQIGFGIETVAPTIIMIGLLAWLEKKIEKNNRTEDEKLNWFGRFIKHTNNTIMALYIIGILGAAGIVASFFNTP